MSGLLLQARIIYGLVANGYGIVAVITGAKDPGNNAAKAVTGNPVIGKTVIKDTDGIKAGGRNKLIKTRLK